MKERIKKILKDYPLIYNFTQKLYWKVQIFRANIFGTSLIEKKWINRPPSELSQIYHSHRKFLVNRISLLNPKSILEIGCNWGPNLYLIAKKFPQCKIKGIDINSEAIEIGNKLFKKEKISNVKLSIGKADEPNQFQDKSFDIVFTDAVLIYIGPDKIKKVIREMIRITRKALIFVEWHDGDQKWSGKYNAHVGVWQRNYSDLLRNFVAENQITISKIPEELWPDENWQKYGYIIEVKL